MINIYSYGYKIIKDVKPILELSESTLYTILKRLEENKMIEVSVKDLVAEYVGQTAPKTMSVIEKAMDRDNFMTPNEALDFGLIDHIITNRSEIK